MHHFIYPSQDTYITNTVNYPNKNFGLDEILRVGTKDSSNRFTLDTTTFSYNSQSVVGLCVSLFTGTITSGSINGFASYITASCTGGSGSISGSAFSGSGVLNGQWFSGSATGCTGTLSSFAGRMTGTVTGHYTVSQSHQVVRTKRYVNRALVKFDLTAISQSVVSGNISSPHFTLKLSVSKEEEVPIEYLVYAYPISQSWVMGDGYLSDGGSTQGASWNYKDYYSGSYWTYVTDPNGLTPIDFIGTSSLTQQVWNRGGGTWYTSAYDSQSFSYEVGDINMDVTNIVYAWLSGSIPNEGFILISGEETEPTGSDMGLYYFSQDSNTIYRPHLDVGWNDFTWTTGSVSTGSVVISTIPSGYNAWVTNGEITDASVYGTFHGTSNYSVDVSLSASGVIDVTGLTGSIQSRRVYGNFSGSSSSSYDMSTLATSSYLLGGLLNGAFSGSIFTSSVVSYTLPWGYLTGSWISQSIVGSQLKANLPFPIYPSIYCDVWGSYIYNTALGTFNITNSLTSASFDGVFVAGLLMGGKLKAQLSGTFLTSSYSYTSSVTMASMSLEPVQFTPPFVTVIQNLPPTVRAGNIVRINLFARPEFPFKNFQRRTQFTQYLTPQYLPTESYYAIKDNETDQIVLDFDNNTKLSCDVNGNYFLLDTTGLPQERYFKVLIRSEQSSSIYTFDKGDIFKIVR